MTDLQHIQSFFSDVELTHDAKTFAPVQVLIDKHGLHTLRTAMAMTLNEEGLPVCQQ